mmetsp:Transcript_73271/g.85114  ORF Transcript_73271/g.85114 Transcript_73271/m.85114 type:complete len:241 (+) Transcript_73271:263-985(+)
MRTKQLPNDSIEILRRQLLHIHHRPRIVERQHGPLRIAQHLLINPRAQSLREMLRSDDVVLHHQKVRVLHAVVGTVVHQVRHVEHLLTAPLHTTKVVTPALVELFWVLELRMWMRQLDDLQHAGFDFIGELHANGGDVFVCRGGPVRIQDHNMDQSPLLSRWHCGQKTHQGRHQVVRRAVYRRDPNQKASGVHRAQLALSRKRQTVPLWNREAVRQGCEVLQLVSELVERVCRVGTVGVN